MKLIWVVLFLPLKGFLFSVSVEALIPKYQILISHNKQFPKNQLPKDQILPVEPHQALILGRWRGYQETPDFTIYYGYEFRPNGVYVARHRVYQQEKTILDQYWQGQWTFDGKILNLEGRVTNSNSKIFKYNFSLDSDNLLYYQGGDLSAPYLPGKMGKFN